MDHAASLLLVLDLDGTILVTAPSSEEGEGEPDFTTQASEHQTRLRPGLAVFLANVQSLGFDLAVWTAAPATYAEEMISGIERTVAPGFRDALRCVFTDEQTSSEWERLRLLRTKELRKLSEHLDFPFHRILVVDDTASTYRLNPRNALPVPEFVGEPTDTVLAELQEFLASLDLSAASTLDVSGWRWAPAGSGPLTHDAIRGYRRGSLPGAVPAPLFNNSAPTEPGSGLPGAIDKGGIEVDIKPDPSSLGRWRCCVL